VGPNQQQRVGREIQTKVPHVLTFAGEIKKEGYRYAPLKIRQTHNLLKMCKERGTSRKQSEQVYLAAKVIKKETGLDKTKLPKEECRD